MKNPQRPSRQQDNTAACRPAPAGVSAARALLAASEQCDASFETAEILPNAAYNGESFWDFEKWAIFDREWLCVGHVSQIPAVGDYLSIRLLDEPLIVVRDAPESIRVMSAICQHRGHPLTEGLAKSADPSRCSRAKVFICPYHSWSYKLDGRLQSAPSMDKTIPLVQLRDEIRLPQIKTEIFLGLIFINFDDAAEPLAPTLQAAHAELANFGLPDLVATPVITGGPYDWNWKIYQENSLEPYHTDFVHRHSHNPAPAKLSKFYPFERGDGQIITTTDFSSEAQELFHDAGLSALPQIENLSDEQRGRLLFISVMPVLFLVAEAGSVLVTLALPVSAEKTELKMFSLYPREATERPDFEANQQAQLEHLQRIVAEDLETQAALHRGHRSRFSPAGRFSWLEATIPQMNRWLLERYRRAVGVLDAETHTV